MTTSLLQSLTGAPPKHIQELLAQVGTPWDPTRFAWDPTGMNLIERSTGARYNYGNIPDPSLGTDVVTNLSAFNANGPGAEGTFRFDPGVNPFIAFPGESYHAGLVPNSGIFLSGDPAEIAEYQDSRRDRDWQGIARVATVVGGGAALGGGVGGAGAGGGGFGAGIAPGAFGVPGMNMASLGLRGAGLLGSGAMASGKGGGGGGAGDAAAIQSELAQRLLTQTDPLRQALIDRSGAFLNGGAGMSPQFAAFKAAAEPQFASARDRIIASTPAGGQLTAALTQLEGDRAQSLAQAQGAIDESELSRAMTLATGMTGQSLGTLGNAANVQAMIAQSEADREAGMLGALGAGAGAYFGSKA